MGFYGGKLPTRLSGKVYDSNNQVGTASSVLVSTGSDADWKNSGDLVVSGLGTVQSTDTSSLLSQVFETPRSYDIGAATSVTISADSSSGNIAYTRLNQIVVGSGSTVVVSSGTTFIMNVLSLF
jgi:hypothetical protein